MSRAYLLFEPGPISNLKLTEVDKPQPLANEILIATKAISINPVDAKSRAGKGIFGRFKDELPLILGWDVSGIVESVGADVTQFKPGDEVFGMVNFPGLGKAYADHVVAPADQIALKPKNISFEKAAAATLAPLTALQILEPNVKPGDKVIIQAAAGGVGHFAVQIAKILGNEVTAITSTKNIDFVKSLGADHVIDYHQTPYEDARGFDFALDTLSGENLKKLSDTVSDGGIIYTLPSGANNEDLSENLKKRNVTLGFHMVHSDGEGMEQIADWLDSNQLKVEISQVYDFEDLPKAHESVESGRTRGKIVVRL
ncbi:NADP-dependent oxidoreductase [Flavobacterium sp. MAH-1]|uniref:NADP-dependent oxidoreductase n=1 Tax=Flavobacterium agri TaxID=2743471 RepID=A0A7Y8Y509_9FLAO|nr:NADP-dependent oxidoreductase [Flavobacterium agri]NUY82634.1 NADP-dependent oxidoreductase [Flavobacterium agri]NYA72657.1 NADP-dependent oxidoreductase [Flavobacterium agri]